MGLYSCRDNCGDCTQLNQMSVCLSVPSGCLSTLCPCQQSIFVCGSFAHSKRGRVSSTSARGTQPIEDQFESRRLARRKSVNAKPPSTVLYGHTHVIAIYVACYLRSKCFLSVSFHRSALRHSARLFDWLIGLVCCVGGLFGSSRFCCRFRSFVRLFVCLFAY